MAILPSPAESAQTIQRITVCSRQEFEGLRSHIPSCIAISITDPDSRPALQPGGLLATLALQFYDLDMPDALITPVKTWWPMSRQDADRIIHFIESWKYHAHHCVVHCEAGISRSAGVAIALSRCYNLQPTALELMEMKPCFNRHVASLVESSFHLR